MRRLRPTLPRLVNLVSLLVLTVISSGCDGADSAGAATGVLAKKGCDPTQVRETDGYRRLALIVGVGEYENPKIPDLIGPPNDAKRIAQLLSGPNGYGFPEENVCVLLNAEATTAAFTQAFEKSLLGRVNEKNDVAVLFFAMHGSQTRDRNGDEPDEWDETLLFHDARVGEVHDLVDDQLNQLLARLNDKTDNVTVIFDTCNSGTATRAPDAGTTRARFVKPDESPAGPDERAVVSDGGDGGTGWAPEAMPGMVVFSAATDSNSALEREGRGIFTDALLQVMAQVGNRPLTYAQVARQVPPLVAAESPQVPYFHGNLSKPVFGNEERQRPISWEVVDVGPPLALGGAPLPGLDVGAELRLYDGSVTGADTRDPGKAKATIVVTEMTGLNAKARLSTPARAGIQRGDLAVLVRPADQFVKLKVRLRPAGEPGGIPRSRATGLRKLIADNPETSMLVDVTEGAGDFEVSVGSDGKLVLRGPENSVRNVYADDRELPGNLWQHARQRALLHLRGEGGNDFVDNRTLLARLVPAPKQNACADGIWEQAEANQEQAIPLCHAFNLQVSMADDAPAIPLLIGALILSSDGSVYALPSDDRKLRLQPGETVTFNAKRETFRGTPPLDAQDRILVFGTQETNPVTWSLFTETAQTRSATATRAATGALSQALDRYLKPGTRGMAQVEEETAEQTTWTMSSLTARVLANARFLEVAPGSTRSIDPREYTIAHFDVRPYLPDNESTALFKVLDQADQLAKRSVHDGVGYKQHDWSQPTDDANLERGIDCSRAIWFAFTRAGLPYNREDRYLSTAMMVQPSTWMQDQFESCSNDPNLRIGDVLVYRDDQRGDGHVVMVIDPDKRIAWGSHGWDGNPRVLPVEPDTGVEYQKIKYKQDWKRWDRSTMERKACWRYRGFIEEHQRGLDQPGVKALAGICSPKKQCGQL